MPNAPELPDAAADGEPAPAPAPAPAGGPNPRPPESSTLLPLNLAAGILAVIAVVAALYLARAFFVPLLIGILLSYALRPVVGWLNACHLPGVVSSGLVVGSVIAAVSWGSFSMGDDAAAMIEQLPDAARKLRQHVSDAQQGAPTALQNFQEAATELQGAATDATGNDPVANPAVRKAPLRQSEPSVWLRDYMLTQSALLFTVAAQAPIVLLLTFFLLASGEHFRRKLLQLVGPSLARRKDAVRILDEIDVQIQRYLLVTVSSNIMVGIGTWVGFAALGMNYAGAWGVTAGVLHFIPYLGPLLFALACGMAAFMQFGTVAQALAVSGASLAIAFCVGSLIVTWLQSRFARVNAAVLFIALLFFGWLWGIWGLLLGAPLVAIAKVIADRVDSLKAIGAVLGP